MADWFDQNAPSGGGGASGGPANGDYQSWFNSLIAGKPFNQQTLRDLEPQLKAAGVQLTPGNKTSGAQTKIGIPDGNGGTQWVRVVGGDNQDQPVWLPQGSGQGASPNELASYGMPLNPYASKPFGGNYQTPSVPSSLSSPYEVPQWTGGDFVAPTKAAELQTPFALPTQAELEASPGYQSRLAAAQQAQERSAAAKGSILNGGFQNALGKSQQDYASNEYGNLFGQKLATRQENVGEYQGDFMNAFNTYQQKYDQYLSQAQLGMNARQQNQGEFQQNVLAPSLSQYQNQYQQYLGENQRTLNDYLTNYTIGRTGVQDFLNQQNTTADRGLRATLGGAP